MREIEFLPGWYARKQRVRSALVIACGAVAVLVSIAVLVYMRGLSS